MPVTKTAKRALRSSKRKETMNKKMMVDVEIAIRQTEKSPSAKAISKAISLVDRAAKRKLLHKNKAARLKSRLSKLTSKPKQSSTKNVTKKAAKTSKASKK